MRNLILLLVGLAVGAVAATSAMNALASRDAYPRGLMNVMQHHYATLREQLRGNRCDAAPAHIDALRLLSREIDDAMFPDESPDAPFREYEQRLDDGLAAAATAGKECATLKPAVEKITAACDACHHQYR